MAKFSRRFIWLKNLFPPATAINIQPGEFGEDISPVHQVLNGTDRLNEFFEFNGIGAAGVSNLISGAAPARKFWFVFACDMTCDDPIARDQTIQIRSPAPVHFAIASATAQPQNLALTVPRSFIIPPRCALRAITDAIAAGAFIRMHFLYLELDLGEPAPPSP